MWNLFNAGWFALLIGTILSVGGIWFSIYSHRKNRQLTSLRLMQGHTPLIGRGAISSDERLKILYEDRAVDRVTSSNFGLWNDGTTTIRGSDIVERDPLAVSLDGDGEILRATIEGVTRDINEVAVETIGPDSVRLRFAFLDPHDGFRIQVLHSGDPQCVRLHGSVIGLPQGIRPKYEVSPVTKRLFHWAFYTFIALVVCLILTMLGTAVYSAAMAPWPSNLRQGLMIGGFIAIVLFSAKAAPAERKIKGVPDIISSDPTLY